MDFYTKRHSKKMTRIFTILAYVSTALFFMNIFILILLRQVFSLDMSATGTVIGFLIFLSPLFGAMLFLLLSSLTSMVRYQYRANIREYRERRYFNIALDYAFAGEIDKARKIYEWSTIKKYHDFLFPFIITMSLKSEDPMQVAKGNNAFEKIRKIANPNDVILN